VEYYDPRLILRFLHPPARVIFFLLCLLLLYATYFMGAATVRMRSLRRQRMDRDSLRQSLYQLDSGAANLRQAISAVFFFFGLTFFLQIPDAFTLLYSSGRQDWIPISQNMAVYFEFAAEIFLIFFVVQCFQWFISSRIQSALRRLEVESR
jgi:hypothetical protein